MSQRMDAHCRAHCQQDNPTLGQELMIDWLADVFGIDQTRLAFYPG